MDREASMIRRPAPDSTNRYQRIYSIVTLIPEGRVATYGQIAVLAGMAGQARLVGYALSSLKDVSIPWHRVINVRGEISPRSGGNPADELQRLRLEREGIVFDSHGRIPLRSYQWQPEPSICGELI
jgi:methylated-DNA-protein-cysteine methyltransferase related protein